MLILRDVFVGINRFDDMQRDLGIARNVLAERLESLVWEGVLEARASAAGGGEGSRRLTQIPVSRARIGVSPAPTGPIDGMSGPIGCRGFASGTEVGAHRSQSRSSPFCCARLSHRRSPSPFSIRP